MIDPYLGVKTKLEELRDQQVMIVLLYRLNLLPSDLLFKMLNSRFTTLPCITLRKRDKFFSFPSSTLEIHKSASYYCRKQRYSYKRCTDKVFKGTVVNWTCHSIHENDVYSPFN